MLIDDYHVCLFGVLTGHNASAECFYVSRNGLLVRVVISWAASVFEHDVVDPLLFELFFKLFRAY